MALETDAAVVVRPALPRDVDRVAQIEPEARDLLRAHGVDLGSPDLDAEIEQAPDWYLGLVAEIGGNVIASGPRTDLGDSWLALDQTSVEPRRAHRARTPCPVC